jgi:hypothetical protein
VYTLLAARFPLEMFDRISEVALLSLVDAGSADAEESATQLRSFMRWTRMLFDKDAYLV